MNKSNSLSLEQIHEIVHLNAPLDGAMSAALTRGQLPRRQRRHHHRHQRRHHHHHHRSHQRHHHHLKSSNNSHLQNNHHHHYSPPHHGHNCHGQYQYSSQQQTDHECHHDKLENDDKHTHVMDENEEPTEKRPKVNPIFLWALQREQRIVEVRCEDYDKRNRIKLTKTPHGWRSIPRTSSNVYSSCCCAELNYISLAKDKPASSSPSVSSTCVPRSVSLKSVSPSPSSMSESMSFSDQRSERSESCNIETRKKNKNRRRASQCKTVIEEKIKRQKRHLRCHISDDDESDATRSSCRNSQQSYDLSYTDDQVEDPDDVDCQDNDVYNEEYEFDDEDNQETCESNHIEKSSRFLNCDKKPFRHIDLETAQKNQLFQPRVVLEPLNTFSIYSNGIHDRARLDDEIEMIVEDKNNDEENKEIKEQIVNGKDEINNVNIKISNFNKKTELLIQHHCAKMENSEDEIEEIEEIEDKDDVGELDEESATVFEYEDRDSSDMMDDDELEVHDEELLKPTQLLPPIVDDTDSIIHTQTISPKTNIEKQQNNIASDGNKQAQVSANILQVPDLKPINNDVFEKALNKFELKNFQIHGTCIERLLPSPPCSVTCSEDASRVDSSQTSPVTPNRRRREAPDLIEVKPTEWRRRGELLKPAYQLRELIEKSGHSIPDPLLVPRDRLPALAANPAIEIPRLLVTRPELRLPEALARPELVADPDILVISLSHLQQVLDAVPEPIKYRNDEKVYGYELPSGTSIAPNFNSERKRLSVKPIGSLMAVPMDLSRHSATIPNMENSIFHIRNKFSKQESEVTSTARLPGDDSRLWHPLFGCRQKTTRQDDMVRPKLISHQTQDTLHHQRLPNYQQHQDTDHQHRASWHRTTLAS